MVRKRRSVSAADRKVLVASRYDESALAGQTSILLGEKRIDKLGIGRLGADVLITSLITVFMLESETLTFDNLISDSVWTRCPRQCE